MKKVLVIGCAMFTMIACKNQTEEVKVDETKMELPADTLAVENDTIAVTDAVKETDNLEVASEKIINANKTVLKKDEKVIASVTNTKNDYAAFGSKISADKALTAAEMLKKYKGLKTGDTLSVKFKSKIAEVCKKKGCWMSMELPGEKESFVRFKDYAFFVPLNADNSEAIVSGRAYIDVVSVAELQHYAKDGGKSQDEINKITEPKVTYAFQADGVLIAQ